MIAILSLAGRPRPRRVLTVLLLSTLAVVCLGSAAAAQFGFGRGFRQPPRFPTEESFGRGFNTCRGMYDSVRREAGGIGWGTDYPDADINFSIRLGELTRTRVARGASGAPEHVVVRMTDDALFECPFVMMSDVGTAAFSDAEIEGLRAYLLKGGFLWVDDFWGTYAWQSWAAELGRVLPPGDYPIHDVPLEHPIYRAMFVVQELPQVPSIQHWRGSGDTSERGSDSETANMRAVFDAHGRVMVLMTHNTDIADAWEREGEDEDYFYAFSPIGYSVGLNVILHAMTH